MKQDFVGISILGLTNKESGDKRENQDSKQKQSNLLWGIYTEWAEGAITVRAGASNLAITDRSLLLLWNLAPSKTDILP